MLFVKKRNLTLIEQENERLCAKLEEQQNMLLKSISNERAKQDMIGELCNKNKALRENVNSLQKDITQHEYHVKSAKETLFSKMIKLLSLSLNELEEKNVNYTICSNKDEAYNEAGELIPIDPDVPEVFSVYTGICSLGGCNTRKIEVDTKEKALIVAALHNEIHGGPDSSTACPSCYYEYMRDCI